MNIKEQEIQDMFARLKPTYGGVWQDYFSILYLMREFGLTEEEAAAQTAFGGNDYGVDAFHLAADRKNLYLYQFKWSADHKLFADSIRRITQAGLSRIFSATDQDKAQNDLIDQLKHVLHEKQDVVARVYMHCVFRGPLEAAENSKHLEALREELESCRYHLDEFFKRTVDLTFEFVSVAQSKRGARARASKTVEFPISLQSPSDAAATPAGQTMVVGFVPLHELHGFYKAMQHRLFDRNIRFGLSSDNPPNREIRKSLENIVFKGEPAEAFAFHHNGVSIAAQALKKTDEGYRIVEPRVLNGAQTIMSVARFLELQEKNPLLRQNEDRFKAVKVLAKIVISPGLPEFVTTVTINNNRQNPVEPWNLRANDDIQLQFQDAFAERGIYYERQQGAFENMSDDDLQDLNVTETKAVELRPLTKTLLALHGEVKRMSNTRELFESEKGYANTFRSEYLGCDFRELVLCYKIGRRLRAMVGEIMARGENKYWYITRAGNLLWALAIQGILNDPDREFLADSYGRDLRLPAGFTDALRDTASKRLRMIIGSVVEREHIDAVANGQTAFLNSNAMYEACLAYAKKTYKWERRGLRTAESELHDSNFVAA